MRFVDIHTHNNSIENDVFALVNVQPRQDIDVPRFSVGIHPWYADKFSISEVEKCCNTFPLQCLAIGECGIDALKSPLDLPEQENLFRKHLMLAEKYNLPLILHLVRANHIFCRIIKDFPNLTFVWHGFNGSLELVNQLKKYNIYYCFSTKNAKKINLWQNMDFHKIVCETDDSKSKIQDVYASLADIRGVEIEKLKIIIGENSNKVLNYVVEK